MRSSMGLLSASHGQGIQLKSPESSDSHSLSSRLPPPKSKIFFRPKGVFDNSKCRQDLHTVRGTLAPPRPSRNGGDETAVCMPTTDSQPAAVGEMSTELERRHLSTTKFSSTFQLNIQNSESLVSLPAARTDEVVLPRGLHQQGEWTQSHQQDQPRLAINRMASAFRVFATNLCNGLENTIRQLEKPPAHVDPSLMPKTPYLAPIEDETRLHTNLEVVGELPTSLNGAYIRTGPNPQLSPSAGYCFFDGDGMLHSVRMKDGKATYCARYVRTSRFKQERAAKQLLFIKPFGELHGTSGLARMALLALRAALGLVDLSEGWGAANTGLTFFNKKLMAMSEDDLPYIIKVKDNGDLETLERFDFNGELKGAMTSHPKVDAITGELFSMSSNFGGTPYLKYFVVSPDGVKGPEVPINIKEPMIAHDFAVTENYAILPDLDLVISMKTMMQGGPAISFDKAKTARLGVLPRYATSDALIQWFDLPNSFCFHYWTAWEENDEIVLTGSILVPADKFFTTQRLDLRYELTEIRLNRATGLASKRILVPHLNLESGQINQKYYGRKCRYIYLAIMEPLPTWVKVSGVAKIDLQATDAGPPSAAASSGPVVGIRYFADEDCLGSEPFFVPRTSDPHAAEDDGYLVTYLHHQATGLSELVVMDAKSPTLNTIAIVKLPGRVPYGLHGIFVSEEQLSTQLQ